jgi:hypothetical protein
MRPAGYIHPPTLVISGALSAALGWALHRLSGVGFLASWGIVAGVWALFVAATLVRDHFGHAP